MTDPRRQRRWEMRPQRRWGDDIALLVVALTAGVGAGRLTSSAHLRSVWLPIALCVTAGHLATAAVGRRRPPRVRAAAPVVGIVAVMLAAVWSLVPGATRHGLPTPTTWRFIVNRFEDAGTVIQGHPTPLPPLSSVVMVLAVAAGLTAVVGRSLWILAEGQATSAGARRVGNKTPKPSLPLVALIPSFGLVCYTALFSSRVDRVPGALSYVGAALLFLLLANRVPALSRPSSNSSPARNGLVTGVVGSTLAVGIALAASTGLSGMALSAFPNAVGNGQGRGPGHGLHSGVPDLIDDVQALLSNDSKDVMFTATSALPTYWQVGVLSRFNGTDWLTDPDTQDAAAGRYISSTAGDIPYLPNPSPAATFGSQLTIVDLQATLLPVPPTTTGVNDPDISEFLPDIGLVQPVPAPAGMSYATVASVPTVSAPSSASQILQEPPQGATAAVGASAPVADLDYYLSLPRIPKRVVTLAHKIVANVSTPFDEAAALARYFDTGKFHYTLYPSVQPGDNPLVSFLFATRAGFCQQFAGAYAVLARLDGLPTRLAIGFTPGISHNGLYKITGADAHVWPQVYLGPSTGWVSFEPTPAQQSEPEATGVVVGSRVKLPPPQSRRVSRSVVGNTKNPVVQPAPTTVPPSRSVSVKGSKLRGINHPGPAGTTKSPHKAASSPVSAVMVLLIVLGTLLVVGIVDAAFGWRGTHGLRRLAVRGRERLRHHLRMLAARLRPHPGRFTPHADGPTTEVIARWEQAARTLEAARLSRRQDETLTEHARRIRGGNLAATNPLAWPPTDGDTSQLRLRRHAFDAYDALTDLATKASYGRDPCSDADAVHAKELCDAVRAGLQ